MKEILVRAYPYAMQKGTMVIPEGLSPEEEHEYIVDHFDEIQFGEPDLGYAGTDFEYNEV